MKTVRYKRHIECFIFCKNKKNILFLLLKRTKNRGGFWQPITGGILPHETARDAVVREVREETGIIEYMEMINTKYKFSFKKCSISFIEEVWAIQVKKQKIHLGPEHVSYKWVTYEKAINMLFWRTNKIALKKINQYLISIK